MIMNIVRVERSNISRIGPMWERLNKHHAENSTHFLDHFLSFTFPERVRQLEKKEQLGVFVAEEDCTDIGYCIASIEDGTGEIDSIFIDSEYRDQGVGKSLISEAESWLKMNNINKVMVAVAEGNEPAYGFYEIRGYQHRFTVFEKEL